MYSHRNIPNMRIPVGIPGLIGEFFVVQDNKIKHCLKSCLFSDPDGRSNACNTSPSRLLRCVRWFLDAFGIIHDSSSCAVIARSHSSHLARDDDKSLFGAHDSSCIAKRTDGSYKCAGQRHISYTCHVSSFDNGGINCSRMDKVIIEVLCLEYSFTPLGMYKGRRVKCLA